MDKTAGPDRGWSWVIVLACCFSSFILAGIFRTSGVLFVAFISNFGVSREEASWPMVVCISVLNLTGPFSGILGQRYGARPIIITGALVATIGISSCYLTTSLKVITILFGGVFGVGYGFMNTLMPGILNSYFLNLRATANGIANSGSCVGSMILPVLFEHFISTYGLSGCFLLTGGIVLHIAIAGSLMRAPSWLKQTNFSLKKDHSLQSNVEGNKLLVESSKKVDRDLSTASDHTKQSTGIGKQLTSSGEISEIEASFCTLNETSEKNTGSPEHSTLPDTNSIKILNDETRNKANSSNGDEHQKTIKQKDNLQIDNPTDERQRSGSPFRYETETDPENPHACSICDSCLCKCNTPSSFLSIFRSFKTVLTCPMFYVTAVTNVSFYFLYHMYVVIIVDYALDSGVQDSRTKYILVAFSFADMFGRLCFGWVTDRHLVSRPRFVMTCMTAIGLVFIMFPFAKDYWSLVTVSCCYGLLLGCSMVVFPILLVDFLGIELHAVSYGCMCFMNGFASFGRPFLIGYFRDSLGSYSNMFYVLGILSIVASALWLLEKKFDRKKNIV